MTSEEQPEIAAAESAPTRTSRAIPWRRLGVSVAALVAVSATAGAVLVVGDVVPASQDLAAPTQTIAVTPSAEQWVCPGPARLTDSESVGDVQFGSAPVDTVSTVTAFVRPPSVHGELAGIGGGGAQPLVRGGDAATLAGAGIVGGGVLTVTAPAAAAAVDAVAGVSSLTTAGDLRGLVAATCSPPGVSRWLVGGSTEVGSSAQLVLQNPSDTPATVRVEVWGPEGPVALGSGAIQVVAPGEETVTLLEATAPEQSRIAVHVTATGAMIGAYIQHNTLDGLVPLGVDDIVSGSEPSTRLAVSGITTTADYAVDDPHAPRLRLLAPGAGAAARIVVLGPEGQVRLRGAEEIDLPPGVVTDVSLGGLPAGTYAVAIESDEPIVAGAVIDRQGEPDPDLLHPENQYDRAWIAAQNVDKPQDGTVAGRGGVALVPSAVSTVTVSAVPGGGLDPHNDRKPTGEFAGTLTAYDAAGNVLGTLDVRVPAGATTVVAAATIAPDAATAPAVVMLDSDTVTEGVVPVWAVLAAAGPTNGVAPEPSLVSVLLPSLPVDSGATVVVRAEDALGLPTG